MIMCIYVKKLMVYCDGWHCIRSTPRDGSANEAHSKDSGMDETANGAHQGSTEDEAVMSSELLILNIICAEWLKMEYFSDEKFSRFDRRRIHLDGWRYK